MARANTQAISAAYLLLPEAFQDRFELHQAPTYSSLLVRPEAIPGDVLRRQIKADFFVDSNFGGFTVKGKDHYPCVSYINQNLGDYMLALPNGQKFRVMDFKAQTYRRLRFDLRDGGVSFTTEQWAIKMALMATAMARFIQDIMPWFDAFVMSPPQEGEMKHNPIFFPFGSPADSSE